MPLEILAIIVAAGLALVIGAVHIAGGRRSGTLSAEAAAEIFRRDCPDMPIADTILSDDRLSALIVIGGSDAVGAVRQMGAHAIARLFTAGTVRRVVAAGDRLSVALRDTTMPRFRLRLTDDVARKRARTLLQALTREG